MKKSLIALAVLAASGAAMAQSSVTLFGVADAYVGQTSTTTRDASGVETKAKQTVVNSGGLDGSRWGMNGTEDLGGGLKANFVLDSGFSIDNGAGGTDGLFGRKATVGLSGAFGAVDLGRNYTAYHALRGATNNVYDSGFATTGTVWNNGVQDYAVRINNSITYTSPSFGGISGAVAVGLGENKTATQEASDNISFHLKYANGPVLVGFAHQREEIQVVPSNKRTYNLIAGSYDFGVAKLTGGYNEAKNNTTKDKEYQLGVSVPFGAASVAAGYTRSKSEVAGVVGSNTGTGYSLLGTYDLSKRTRLYAGVLSTKVGSAALDGVAAYKTTRGAVGVRHAF